MSDELTDSHLSGFVRRAEALMAGWTCTKGKIKPEGSRVKEVMTYKYTDSTGRRVEFEVYAENTFSLSTNVIVPFLNFSLYGAGEDSPGNIASTVAELDDAYTKIRAFRR